MPKWFIVAICRTDHSYRLRGTYVTVVICKAIRSASGGSRPLRSLTRQNKTKTRMTRTEWSMILGANCRLVNAESSVLQENNRDASCMYETKQDGGKEQCCVFEVIGNKRISFAYLLRAAHQLSCFLSGCIICVGRADFDVLLRFDDKASYLSNQVPGTKYLNLYSERRRGGAWSYIFRLSYCKVWRLI